MKVTLGDLVVKVEGWDPIYTSVGSYVYSQRKTPEEIAAEKAAREAMPAANRPKGSINQTKRQTRNIINLADGGRTAYFLPGLWHRVRAAFDARGASYTVEDVRDMSIRPTPDYSALSGIELRHGQDETLALIATCDNGIIKCGTGYGKSFIIAQVCKMYPTLNIVVCTRSSQVVGTLYDYIHKELPGRVGYLYQKGDTTAKKRVVVTTTKSLTKLDPTKVHLMLFDECHDVGDNQAGADVSAFVHCRRFGFSATPIRNDGSAIVMEALFGPVIQEVTYAEAVAHNMVTPIKFVMLPCYSGSAWLRGPKKLPDIIRKKFSYWTNKTRNELISRAMCDVLKASPDLQVLVMVETLGHAIRLNRLRPNFAVAHYGGSDMENLKDIKKNKDLVGVNFDKYKMKPRDLDIMRKAFEKGTLKRVIATTTWRQGCNFNALTVLIRAEARLSEVDGTQIPGRLARLADGKEFGYVIDIDDGFSEWSKERSDARREQYLQQGWTEVTFEEVLDDLKRAVFTGCSGGAGPTSQDGDGGEGSREVVEG